MKTHLLTLWLSLFCLTSSALAQVPPAPNPPQLVNDFAGILSSSGRQSLEAELRQFNQASSNQITVVTLSDLGLYSASQMAFDIGEQWGVGNQKYNNGVVILVKPKTETKGEVFIAPGYGLEPVLPDAVCKRLVEDFMIPYFKRGDYEGGIRAAIEQIKPLAQGEISVAEFEKGSFSPVQVFLILGILVLFFIVFILTLSKNRSSYVSSSGSGANSLLTLLLLSQMGRHGSHGGGFGGGGFGGGFGGFGGGSFGGGGAGGSW